MGTEKNIKHILCREWKHGKICDSTGYVAGLAWFNYIWLIIFGSHW